MAIRTLLIAATLCLLGALPLAGTAGAAPLGASASPLACSSFGTTWKRSYNKAAKKAGNPVRILNACCQSTKTRGVHHCLITVTLAGTKDRGCESVDIGPNGLPAGTGKYVKCGAAK